MLNPDPHLLDANRLPCPVPGSVDDGSASVEAVFPAPSLPAIPDRAAQPPAVAYSGLTAHVLDGLRVAPLASFWWGGTGVTRRPRVRSDHVLMLVDQGGVRIDLPRSGQSCGAGQLVFVPAGSAFAVQPAADAQGAVLRIPSALTRDLTPALPTQLLAGHFSADLRAELGAHLSAIQRDGGLPVASARQAADARLRLLSILLQRADLFSQPQDTRTSVTPLKNGSKRIMRDCIDLAGRELGRGRTLSDLAQAIGVNRVDLDAACQAQRGQTALEMLYDLRFEGAMALLRGTHDSLGSIATRMGYTGVAHLNRAFVAATGRPAESFRAPGRA